MFKKRFRHRVPALDTTSTSDISFMLLIFFLVTTSIDSDKGLVRHLPPMPQDKRAAELVVKERNILRVAVCPDGRVICDGRPVRPADLTERVKAFVDNSSDSPSLPEKHIVSIPLLGRCSVTDRHVIALEVSRTADYNTYFHVQEAIIAAYTSLRERLAHARFGHGLADCSSEELKAVKAHYPQRISESEPEGQGGDR